MQIINELFDAESVYPFEMTKETAAYKMYTFAGENTEKFSLTFHISPQLGNKAVTVKLGQATGAGGAYFKPLVKKFSSPMRVIATLLAVVREYAKEDVKGKTKLGFAFGLPMAHFGAYQKLVGKLINREMRGILKTFESQFEYSDDKYAKGLQFTFATRVGKTPKMAFNGEIGDAIASGSPAVEDAPAVDSVPVNAPADTKPEPAPAPTQTNTEPPSTLEAMFGTGGYALLNPSAYAYANPVFAAEIEKTGRVVVVGQYIKGIWLVRPFSPSIKPEDAKADYSANMDMYIAYTDNTAEKEKPFEKVLPKQAAFSLAIANIKASQQTKQAEPAPVVVSDDDLSIEDHAKKYAPDVLKRTNGKLQSFIMFDGEPALPDAEAAKLYVGEYGSIGSIGIGWLCYSRAVAGFVVRTYETGVEALESADLLELIMKSSVTDDQLVYITQADISAREFETLSTTAAATEYELVVKKLKPAIAPEVQQELDKVAAIAAYGHDDILAHAEQNAGDVLSALSSKLVMGVEVRGNKIAESLHAKYQVIDDAFGDKVGLGVAFYNVIAKCYVIVPCSTIDTYDKIGIDYMDFAKTDFSGNDVVIMCQDYDSAFGKISGLYSSREQVEAQLELRNKTKGVAVEAPVLDADMQVLDTSAQTYAGDVYYATGGRLYCYANISRQMLLDWGVTGDVISSNYLPMGDTCLTILFYNAKDKAYVGTGATMLNDMAKHYKIFANADLGDGMPKFNSSFGLDQGDVKFLSDAEGEAWIAKHKQGAEDDQLLADLDAKPEPVVAEPVPVASEVKPVEIPTDHIVDGGVSPDHPYYSLFGGKTPVYFSMVMGKLGDSGWFKIDVQKAKGYAMAIYNQKDETYMVVPMTTDAEFIEKAKTSYLQHSDGFYCRATDGEYLVSNMTGRIKKIVPYAEALKKSGLADALAAKQQGGAYFKSLFKNEALMFLEVDKSKVKHEAYHFKKSKGVCFAVFNANAGKYVVIPAGTSNGSTFADLSLYHQNNLTELLTTNAGGIVNSSMVKYEGAFVCDGGEAASKIKKLLSYDEALAKSGLDDKFVQRMAQLTEFIGAVNINPIYADKVAGTETPLPNAPVEEVKYTYWPKKFGELNYANYTYVVANSKNPIIGTKYSSEYEVFAAYKLANGSYQMIPWGLTSKNAGVYRAAYIDRTPIAEFPVLKTADDESLVWKVLGYADALARAKRTPDEAFEQFWESKVGNAKSVGAASAATSTDTVLPILDAKHSAIDASVLKFAKFADSDIVEGAYVVMKANALYGKYAAAYAEAMPSAMIFCVAGASPTSMAITSLRRELDKQPINKHFLTGVPRNMIVAVMPRDAAVEIVQKAIASSGGVSNAMLGVSLAKPVAEFLKNNKPAPTSVGIDCTASYKAAKAKLSGSYTVSIDGVDIDIMKATDFEVAGYVAAAKRMIAEGDKVGAHDLVSAISNKGTLLYSALSKMPEAMKAGKHHGNDGMVSYTGGSYSSINKLLRGASDGVAAENPVKEFDAVFKDCGLHLPSDAVVYRGQTIPTVDLETIKGGGKYILHSYTSTTTQLSTAISFSSKSTADHFSTNDLKNLDDVNAKAVSVIFAIRGLNKTLSIIPGKAGSHYTESEIVLNRGTILRLDKLAGEPVVANGDTVYMRVVVVGTTGDSGFTNTLLESQAFDFDAMSESKQADNDSKMDVAAIDMIKSMDLPVYTQHKADMDAYYAEHPEELARWTTPM